MEAARGAIRVRTIRARATHTHTHARAPLSSLSLSLYARARLQDFLDSAALPGACAVACVASLLSVSPARTLLLRNHHNAASRYSGTFRFRLRDAIRATTAAPTVFVPLVQDGLVYCDDSLFANNPTAIALHEARSLFPHVPVECVVSVGTVREPARCRGASRFHGW